MRDLTSAFYKSMLSNLNHARSKGLDKRELRLYLDELEDLYDKYYGLFPDIYKAYRLVFVTLRDSI